MIWSSKDMRTGAFIALFGFLLGAFFFSNGSQLEAMRASRETWKSKAESSQTELYSLNSNCAAEKKSIEATMQAKQSEINALSQSLKDMEAVRKEEIEKLDAQIAYLKERADEMQRKNTELTVLQQTSIGSIEMFTEKNGELLTSLLDILSTAAHAVDSEPEMELGAMPEFDDEEADELVPEADILEELEPESGAQAELNDIQVGFDPPPREVGNAQIHEEEFHQQLNEIDEALQNVEHLQMDNHDYDENVVEETVDEDEFNLEHEMAGVQSDFHQEFLQADRDDHMQHIPEAQAHPIDPESKAQAESELAPPMPVAQNRLIEDVEEEAAAASSKPKKKKKRRKKKRKDS